MRRSRCGRDTYAEFHRHVLGDPMPPLLAEHVADLLRTDTIADVGCGDGSVVCAVLAAGFAGRIVAIDQSESRVQRAAALSDGVRGVTGDATNIPLANSSVGGVVCSQVIEHIVDQHRALSEISRILKPGAWFYVGSVARRPYGWWVYRRDGSWWLDPTHVREYHDVVELQAAVERAGLQVLATNTTPVRFAIADLFVRLLALSRIVSPDVISDLGTFSRLRRVRARIPGYSTIEVFGRTRS